MRSLWVGSCVASRIRRSGPSSTGGSASAAASPTVGTSRSIGAVVRKSTSCC